MNLRTRNLLDFYECASAMQKAIRRNDKKIAIYFGLELFMSGYKLYCWKRLMTISAEDCAGIVTHEIKALLDGFLLVNEGKTEYEKGRIFFSKAVLLLCDAVKDRTADHAQCLIYDKHMVTDEEIATAIKDAESERQFIPEYTFDVHTRIGKMRGMTKAKFFRSEVLDLQPKIEGLWDDLAANQ